MMTISASGIGRIDVGVNQTSDVKKQEENAGDLFSAIMDMKNTSNFNSSATKEPVNAVQKNETNDGKMDYKTSKDDVKYEKITNGNSTNASKDITSSKNNDLKDIEELPEEVISNMIQQLKEIIKESLGVDDDELQVALDSLGLSEQDLLNFDNLKSVTLYLQGASEVDLLISEDIEKLVNELENQYQVVIDEGKDNSKSIVTDNNEESVEPLVNNTNNRQNSIDNRNVTNLNSDIQNNTQIVDINYSESSSSKSGTESRQDESSVMANLTQSFEQVVQSEEVDTIVPFTENVSEADVLRQVIDAVRVNISKDQTSMTLQLNPENLGKVQISVLNRNGMMQAQIIAESEAAKRAIESNLELLKQSFEHQDLRVESVEVTIASYDFFGQATGEEFEENPQSNGSQRTSNLNISDDVEDDLTEEEELQISVMKAQGNSVSYSI